MAEQQLAHRHALETRAIDGKLTAQRNGQALGFVMVLAALIVGGALIAFDKDVSGLTAIVGALASLVAVFVYGRRKDAEERRGKRADFATPQLRLPYEDGRSEHDQPPRSSDALPRQR